VRTDEFDYWLPRAQIAQRPLPQRDASRLLLLERSTGATTDFRFAQLPDLLRGGELLVFNNARVIPARFFGKRAGVHSQSPSRATAKEHLSGIVEVFLTRQVAGDVWKRLSGGQELRVGERIIFGEGELDPKFFRAVTLDFARCNFRAGMKMWHRNTWSAWACPASAVHRARG